VHGVDLVDMEDGVLKDWIISTWRTESFQQASKNGETGSRKRYTLPSAIWNMVKRDQKQKQETKSCGTSGESVSWPYLIGSL